MAQGRSIAASDSLGGHVMTPLERRYRALLRVFPVEYRAGREEEMVGTLLDAAGRGQRWPSAAEAWDLVTSAVSVRFRLATGGSTWWSALEGFRWAGILLLAWKAAGALADAFFVLRWIRFPELAVGNAVAALTLAIAIPAALLALLFGRRSTGRLAVVAAAGCIAVTETFRALAYSGPVDPAWLSAFVLPRFVPVLAAALPTRRWRPIARPLSLLLLVGVALAAAAMVVVATGFAHHPGVILGFYRSTQLLAILAVLLCATASLWDPRAMFACSLFATNAALRDVLAALQYRETSGVSGSLQRVGVVLALGLLASRRSMRRGLAS